MALEAVGNGYESRIEELPELGEEAGLDERVLEAVREALQTGLDQDERISAYLNAISVTVVQEKEPEMEDRFYRYLYRVTVTYKDDAGTEYVRENTAYEAWISKNQPGSDSGSHSGQSYLWAESQRQRPDRRLRKIWRGRSVRHLLLAG